MLHNAIVKVAAELTIMAEPRSLSIYVPLLRQLPTRRHIFLSLPCYSLNWPVSQQPLGLSTPYLFERLTNLLC